MTGLRRIVEALRQRLLRLDAMDRRLGLLQEAVGRLEARQLAGETGQDLHRAEFRTFSQWGEDGILELLARTVPLQRQLFVEFGVQDYSEASTRFLLMHRNWAGLVLDGDERNIAAIRADEIYWRYNLKAQQAFITRENLDGLLRANGVEGDIGLLSIDIDGNDYWVWEGLSAVSPRIVVVEYNARFGPQRAVTVPYDPAFVRGRAHYSMIYYGASLAALAGLGRRRGYALVGCNSAGNNAFFVRADCLPAGWEPRTAAQAYVPCAFRESRDEQGRLAFLDADAERALLDRLPLVEVEG